MASNKLVATKLKTLPQGLHADGNNLFLQVRGEARSWIFRYKQFGKAHDIGLGSLSLVPLSAARQKALSLRQMIADGQSPIATKKAQQRAVSQAVAASVDLALRDIAKLAAQNQCRLKGWKGGETTVTDWVDLIKTHVDDLWQRDIRAITRDDILHRLEKIWSTKHVTATRVQERLAVVYAYAIAKGWATENPAEWEKNLDQFLPTTSVVHEVKHHAALSWAEAPNMVSRLLQYTDVSANALVLCAFTATRAQEFCLAKWEEFDLEAELPVWVIPAERMKRGIELRVPLAPQVVTFLNRLPRLTPFVFPGQKQGRFDRTKNVGYVQSRGISTNSTLKFLKETLGYEATQHGMRSTFRDWCADHGYDEKLAEKALAHVSGNEVERAYQRSDILKRRHALMCEWADFLLPRK